MAAPKLNRSQKDEIIRKLAARDSFYSIAKAMGCSEDAISYYAKKHAEQIKTLREERDARLINQGLRSHQKRVEKLAELAERLEYELSEQAGQERGTNNGGLYLKDVKMSGQQREEVEVFAEPIIRQYRGLLEDIAKELGQRVTKTENKNEDTVFVSGVVGFSPEEWAKLKQDGNNNEQS